MSWRGWTQRELAAIRDRDQWRAPRDLDAAGPVGKLAPDGRRVVSFASNDYLGLTQHPAVIAAAHSALDRWGAGSGSARLIVGSRPIHSELEGELATWKGSARAALFPTGFAANLGVLSTFGTADTLIVSDELNHASIIDGARLSRAEVAVYPHRDISWLDRTLAEHSGRRALVVSDSVFSMDGDVAPVDDLIEVCTRRGALLVLDEAHAVLGPDPDCRDADVLRIGTLSKYLGSLGGFVVGTPDFIDLLVNRARSYIFTTASSPADAAAALAAVRIVRSDEGERLRERLRAHVERIRPGHPSPIIPVMFGDEQRTLAAAAELLERGLLVPAIRPPTVAPGTARLRVALSAAHSDEQIDTLARALDELVR
ncbi:MAG TPA: 8-amino-7-oxononanoate synthase [Acidimicrobiia bacterium]|jgi:8-amino-7-oxononanoate synthase|nr:8-amino-7-oxononanoate synthase [Acidimicrobiia bacterium]